jgi:hypothetical protein
MSTASHKAIVRRFFEEVFDKGNLAQLSQPEGQRTGKVNKNNLHNQKVSTTFGLPAVSVRYDPQQ